MKRGRLGSGHHFFTYHRQTSWLAIKYGNLQQYKLSSQLQMWSKTLQTVGWYDTLLGFFLGPNFYMLYDRTSKLWTIFYSVSCPSHCSLLNKCINIFDPLSSCPEKKILHETMADKIHMALFMCIYNFSLHGKFNAPTWRINTHLIQSTWFTEWESTAKNLKPSATPVLIFCFLPSTNTWRSL